LFLPPPSELVNTPCVVGMVGLLGSMELAHDLL
jgi:hypothetical protein